MTGLLLSAASLAGADTTAGRAVYEFSRLRDFDDQRLALAAVAAAAIALAALVCYLSRRDTVELSRGIRILLAALRCVAVAGLVIFFLGIERRTTREVVHNSQVAVLVDVSQSMGLSDNDESPTAGTHSRSERVIDALTNSPLVTDLRQHHDVNIARFDQEVQPVVSLPKGTGVERAPTETAEPPTDSTKETDATRGAMNAPTPADVNGHRKPQLHLVANETATPPGTTESADLPAHAWMADLQPRGTQTRLGDAIEEQLRLYRGAPLAGVIVISDGAQNAGVEARAAAEAARDANVPIFTIGVGSTQPRRNLSVADLLVPARAFPGDAIKITGYLQGAGFAGQFVDVELLRRGTDEPSTAGTTVTSQRVQVAADGEIVPVNFDIEPDKAGRFVYQLRVQAPTADDNPRDNVRESEMDVVDRETRVLLFSSGPSREYRFLRDQLHRDATMKADVLLQTAQPGVSQDAHEILFTFPTMREELFQYDAIVAFDPDWTKLDADQVALLDSWVSEEAGGMIVVPGPIHTGEWIRSTEHAKLRDLFPVVFQQRLTLMDDGHLGGDVAWPLELQCAGHEARFLWLANSGEESESAWSSFPGVYAYYSVKGEKPGATVYTRIADPEAGAGDHPVYMAGQFYGAGQVLYIGSGEFWRLRSLDPGYFESLYTKMIRHVSQGRLLRGSSRGTLLVERDRYELGETVALRARLTDARHQPLVQDAVTAQVVRPDGSADTVKLQADPQRPGMYFGQFAVRQEGTYQVALAMPDSDEEPITKYLQARVPDLERAHAERNEPLLAALAKETGGQYYERLQLAAYGEGDVKRLADSIPSRSEVKLLKGTPDSQFAQRQMRWLLGVVAGALFVEWIVRRVNRLA